MKILFLHISDLHMKSDNRKNSKEIQHKVDKVVSAVKSLGMVDKYVVICSGDLTYSGLVDEYKSVRKVMRSLLPQIGKINTPSQYVEFYLVPGNHDMVLNDSSRKFADIEAFFKDKREDEEFEKELTFQKHFFEYAKSNKCFTRNQVVHSIVKDYNGFRVQYNLINTAPFSTLKPDDKQLHYLPDSHLYSVLRQDNINLSISIMHHSTEWFCNRTKESLEDTIKNNVGIAPYEISSIPHLLQIALFGMRWTRTSTCFCIHIHTKKLSKTALLYLTNSNPINRHIRQRNRPIRDNLLRSAAYVHQHVG